MTLSKQPISRPLPLENGDRVSRQEFERRYAAMPDLKKAELIEGVVYLPAALRYRSHGRPHANIVGWLATYAALTPGIEAADNPTIRLDLDNEPQPDALLRIDEARGGQSRISQDDYVEGAPELIVEIAASSAAYDLYDKKNVYRRNGVQEYIVWSVADRQVSWFSLEEGVYVSQTPDENGIIRSSVFPGLDLNVRALLDGDMAEVLTEVGRGIGTVAHQQFVQRLE
ncbi:Uma2 family endonuclease [Romeria aff. gracilis LEGE 07310]|uniref:Uma2 family endonuclease n=1 Tax=Vasconcelosia minhoensis LEGE 07310 TaxID=915328 RepID=A0A8J7AH21_9CYAN|nr:Uma2 family endonuclease [Romeria gracilis]MBE9077413.1 Uma2 family endonuclease [Romeria aff. gracilis LEGE 07310]